MYNEKYLLHIKENQNDQTKDIKEKRKKIWRKSEQQPKRFIKRKQTTKDENNV